MTEPAPPHPLLHEIVHRILHAYSVGLDLVLPSFTVGLIQGIPPRISSIFVGCNHDAARTGLAAYLISDIETGDPAVYQSYGGYVAPDIADQLLAELNALLVLEALANIGSVGSVGSVGSGEGSGRTSA